MNDRRLELLLADPVTAPHGGGVLVIDDSGDRKDGTKTAHVGRQWLGRYGKTDNGVVTVTTVWADERLYYPVHAVPYTPARHFAKGKNDPGFRTKLAIGADLAVRARAAGFAFRAVAADSAYGDQDGFRGELAQAGLPFVMALRPRHGIWARAEDAHTPVDAARALAWGGPDDPGDWQAVTRHLPRRARRDLVRRRREAGRLGPGRRPAPGGRHRRPGHPAGQGHLVPGHQPGPARRPARGRQPLAGRGPGRDRADLRAAALGGAVVQAGQGRARLGRLPGPLRHRHPPPPGAGQLRVLLLLGHLAHRSAPARAGAGKPAREGAPLPGPSSPGHARLIPPAPSWPRALRAVRSWLTPATTLTRWWQAWSKAPPPAELQHLLDNVSAGHGLFLYLPP